MMRSSISWVGRLTLVLAGALLLLVGLGVRHHEQDYEGKVDRWIEHDDGTVAIYAFPEEEDEEGRYEFVDVGESTTAVYAVYERFDVRVEVFRGAEDEARAAYGTEEAALFVEVVDIDESTAAVYLGDEARDIRMELMRGALAEVDAWFDAADSRSQVLVFEGSRSDAEAWIDARRDPQDDPVAWIVFTAGVVTMAIGVASGWTLRRGSGEPSPQWDLAFGICGIIVAVAAVSATIWEAANPAKITVMRELAAALSMLVFIVFIAIVVRHHEAHRRGAGGGLIVASVWIAIGLVAFGLLQGLDPMLHDPEGVDFVDALVPDSVGFFSLLLGPPLVLAALGLVRDRAGPEQRNISMPTSGAGSPGGPAPVT